MGQVDTTFAGKTVVLAAGGSALGEALARGYAQAGARVAIIDADEPRALKIASQHPGKVNVLKLDCLHAAQRARFTTVWGDEPLHALVHLQPIRHADQAPAAMTSVVEMTEQLALGLARGQGRVLILHRGAGRATPLLGQALDPAWERLPEVLDRLVSAQDVTVNGLRLPSAPAPLPGVRALTEAAMMLTAPRPSRVGGAVLHLGAVTA